MATPKVFQDVFRDAQAACGDINSEACSGLARQMQRYGVEVASKNYLNPEGLALSIYESHWRELSVLLPEQLERRLINVLPSVTEEQESMIKEFLDGYFLRAKQRYHSDFQARISTRGKNNRVGESFLRMANSKLESYRRKATEALTSSIKTRRAQEGIRKRENRTNVMIGIFIGAAGSLLAQWIWIAFFIYLLMPAKR